MRQKHSGQWTRYAIRFDIQTSNNLFFRAVVIAREGWTIAHAPHALRLPTAQMSPSDWQSIPIGVGVCESQAARYGYEPGRAAKGDIRASPDTPTSNLQTTKRRYATDIPVSAAK